MKEAIGFIKEYGIHTAKTIINSNPKVDIISIVDAGFCVRLNDLKQIVEAFEMVKLNGGLISAKKYLKFLQSSIDIGLYHGLNGVNYETEIPLIKQAIELVEKCNA